MPDCCVARTGHLDCRVTEHVIPNAPAFLRGVRALFVSDVHAVERTTREDMDALVRRMAGTRPDLLLLGGDYADAPEPALRLLRALRGFSTPLGAFAVVGNNDREAFPDVEVLRRAMAKGGITLLVNGARTLRVNGGRLVVAGLDEYRYGRPEVRGLYHAEAAPNRYRLLLSHYPRAVDPMPDLMLSGHTHGGQFNALGVTPYAIGFERILAHRRASNYIAGLHPHRGGWMLVSKGIGASRIPLRVGVRPEINAVTFG